MVRIVGEQVEMLLSGMLNPRLAHEEDGEEEEEGEGGEVEGGGGRRDNFEYDSIHFDGYLRRCGAVSAYHFYDLHDLFLISYPSLLSLKCQLESILLHFVETMRITTTEHQWFGRPMSFKITMVYTKHLMNPSDHCLNGLPVEYVFSPKNHIHKLT
jgi:hypothetical protein